MSNNTLGTRRPRGVIARSTSASVGAMLLCIALVPRLAAEDKAPLSSFIPDDVFIYVGGQHNPNTEFIEAYWGEVLEALDKSGVFSDAVELVMSAVGESDKNRLAQICARFAEPLEAVEWKALVGGEVAFAERFPTAKQNGSSISVGPPEIVVLMRNPSSDVARNTHALRALLAMAVDEANNAAGKPVIQLNPRSDHGAEYVLLSAINGPPAEMFSMAIGRHGDTIFFTLGHGIRDQVLSMMEGKGSAHSLANSKRFQEAIATLPKAKDALTFVDTSSMLSSIRSIIDITASATDPQTADKINNADTNPEANELDNQAIAAYQEGRTDEAIELLDKAHAIDPTDTRVLFNLACMHALGGDKAKALDWLDKAVDGGFHAPNQIRNDDDLKSLREEQRFVKAVERATKGAGGGGDTHRAGVLRVVERLFKAASIIDYVVSTQSTRGRSTYTEAIAKLTDHADQSPLYPIFGKRDPIGDFARYLPRETVSFSVSSGIDLDALYTFIEDTIKEAGEPGTQAWAAWTAAQEQHGFNVRRDVLSWIDGRTISATIRVGGQDASIVMLKVRDEEKAKASLATAMTFLSQTLGELATTNPMLGMLAIRTEPSDDPKLEGFVNIFAPMMPTPAICGVRDGYLIFATTEDALELCLKTAAGDYPNVTKNEQVMSEAPLPGGSAVSVSFTDHRNVGQEIAMMLGAASMAGGMVTMMIPDPDDQRMVGKLIGIIGKLAPIAAKIDFFKSTASNTTFDGKAWHTRAVTNYFAPDERAKSTAIPVQN